MAGFAFGFDVSVAGRVVANKDDGEVGWATVLGLESLHLLSELVLEGLCYCFAVEKKQAFLVSCE